MKTVTVTASCTADLTETWVWRVPDDWQPPVAEEAVLGVLGEEGCELVSVSNEPENERDRVVLEVLVEDGEAGE